MVVVMLQRTILFMRAMIFLLMAVFRAAMARMVANLDAGPAGCERTPVEPGEHAEHHEPCEKTPHQWPNE